MEDQILPVDKTQEATSDMDLSKKLLKKEQRLFVRLQAEQEAEARALDRFQRAQKRLQRRRGRLERIAGKLVLVRKQIADLKIIVHQTVYSEPEVGASSSVESVSSNALESEGLSSSDVESTILRTSVLDQEREATSISADSSDVFAPNEGEERGNEQGHSVPWQGTSSPTSLTPASIEGMPESETVVVPERGDEQEHSAPQQETSYLALLMSAPLKATPEPEALSISDIDTANTTLAEAEQAASSDSTTDAVPTRESAETASSIYAESDGSNTTEQKPVASADSPTVETEVDAAPEVHISSDSIVERKPTQPLRIEQEDQPAAGSFSPDIQSAKEAWVAAESAMQRARNAAHGIAASISYLSQTDGLSNEFMEELVHKQADANKELLKAQEAARAAYERFVQAQKDAEFAASQPVAASMNTSENHSQQKQKDGALPPAEDNGDDQTAKMHAIRLYNEW